MPKRGFPSDEEEVEPLNFDLDEEQQAVLEQAQETLPPRWQCMLPVLEALRKASRRESPQYQKPIRARQATEYTRTVEAASAFGIDYEDLDWAYTFKLREEHIQKNAGQLSEHFAAVIDVLKTSKYVNVSNHESFLRTILDLMIIDRLRHLKEKNSPSRFKISAQVPLSVRTEEDQNGNHDLVQGTADWILNYGSDKENDNTGANAIPLVIVEAKPYKRTSFIGLPQLVIYMAAVQESRKDKGNQTAIFGMVSNVSEFRFAFLNEEKKLFLSGPLLLLESQEAVIAYIDAILMTVIESSSGTTMTAQKAKDRALADYRRSVGKRWKLGNEPDDEVGEDEGVDDEVAEDDDDTVDVARVGRKVVFKAVVHRSKLQPDTDL